MFFSEILPPLSPSLGANIVQKVFKQLVDKRVYTKGRWSAFPIDPSESTRENLFFTGLVTITTAIDAAVSTISKGDVTPTVQLVNDPSRSLVCIMRDTKSQPDGCFVLPVGQSEFPDDPLPHWMDVALAGGCKRKDRFNNLNDVSLIFATLSSHIILCNRTSRRCYGTCITS